MADCLDCYRCQDAANELKSGSGKLGSNENSVGIELRCWRTAGAHCLMVGWLTVMIVSPRFSTIRCGSQPDRRLTLAHASTPHHHRRHGHREVDRRQGAGAGCEKTCPRLDPGWEPDFRQRNCALVILALMPGLISCTSAVGLVAESALAEPDVVMSADPQPPFTYRAPEDIRNHPHQAGIRNPRMAAQALFRRPMPCIGVPTLRWQALDALPDKIVDSTWRLTCSLSDLSWVRLNISFRRPKRLRKSPAGRALCALTESERRYSSALG